MIQKAEDEIIIFSWRGSFYSIPLSDGDLDLILLPSGQVLIVENWEDLDVPTSHRLRLAFLIDLPKSINNRLGISRLINAAFATQVARFITYTCPLGCPNPTHPYCSECGYHVDAEVRVIPISTTETPVEVIENGNCPNCSQSLVGHTRQKNCPFCGQSLNWLVRG